jgi:hypothetical protein
MFGIYTNLRARAAHRYRTADPPLEDAAQPAELPSTIGADLSRPRSDHDDDGSRLNLARASRIQNWTVEQPRRPAEGFRPSF